MSASTLSAGVGRFEKTPKRTKYCRLAILSPWIENIALTNNTEVNKKALH